MPSSLRKPAPAALAAFGARVVAMRELLGISQRELGRRIGKTSGYMYFLESGRTQPTAGVLEELAKAFGVTMDSLWKGLEEAS